MNRREPRLTGYFVIGLIGMALGFLIAVRYVDAAPTTAPETAIPAAIPKPVRTEGNAASGNLAQEPSPVSLGSSDSSEDSPATPDTEIGTAIEAGLATWCAPTPKHCHGWGGDAHVAAVPGYGGRPYRVTVCRQDNRSVCTSVVVLSSCACGGGHIIDLSVAAFEELAPRSRGVVAVTVEDERVAQTPPPTDVGQ